MNRQIEEIKLPIEEKPEIVSRNIHALRLSIIQKSDKSGINYVYNNYIQMMYKKERKGHITFDYVFPKYQNLSIFRTCSIDKPTLTINSINIKDFIVRGLLCKKYVITSVDEYYIENRRAYKSHHFGHDILIYGYNAQKNIFHVMGYTSSGYYRPSTVDCFEFVTAYLNSYGNKAIELVETVSYYHHRIEKELIAASLEDYIKSENKSRLLDKSKWLEDNETYGINTLNKIKAYLEELAYGDINIDKRIMYTLSEHKKLMLGRYEHLLKNGFIKENADLREMLADIHDKSRVGFNLFLKYMLSKDPFILTKISSLIDYIRELELKAIPLFIYIIKEGVPKYENTRYSV